MTASLLATFSNAKDKTTQISSWLAELPPTPPADEERWPPPRKRAAPEPPCVYQPTAMSINRNVSPSKRRRRDTDDLLPEESASAVGSNTRPLILGSSTTFSPPGSRVGALIPRRSNSPSRETIAALRVASPPITTEPLDGVESEPPARVMAVVAQLENGLDHGWVPGWLEVCASYLVSLLNLADLSQNAVKADTDIGFQRFKPVAFSNTATRDLSDPSLDTAARTELKYTLRKVKKNSRRHCIARREAGTRMHGATTWSGRW